MGGSGGSQLFAKKDAKPPEAPKLGGVDPAFAGQSEMFQGKGNAKEESRGGGLLGAQPSGAGFGAKKLGEGAEKSAKPMGQDLFGNKGESDRPVGNKPPQPSQAEEKKGDTAAKGPTEAKSLEQLAKEGAPKPAASGTEDKFVEEKKKHAQQWHDNFARSTLKQVSQKWSEDLQRNKTEFDNAAQQLQKYEFDLMNQMKTIDTVEASASSIRQQF